LAILKNKCERAFNPPTEVILPQNNRGSEIRSDVFFFAILNLTIEKLQTTLINTGHEVAFPSPEGALISCAYTFLPFMDNECTESEHTTF